MKSKISAHCILFCFLLVVCTRCVSFPGNELPSAESIKPLPSSVNKPSITYSFALETLGQESKGEARDMFKKPFIDTFTEAGYPPSLSLENKGDIHIVLDIHAYTNEALFVWGAFAACTLMILPCGGSETYDIIASVTAKTGKKFHYEIRDSAATLIWLPLAVVPSNNLAETKKLYAGVWRNMWKTLLFRMQQDGIIPTQAKTAANTAK
jgi:hypothetical protein